MFTTSRKPFLLALWPFFSLLCMAPAYAQQTEIRVAVSDLAPQKDVLLSPIVGRFALMDGRGDTLYTFRSDDVVSVKVNGDSLLLKGVYGLDATTATLTMTGNGPRPSFLIKRGSDSRELTYPGTLTVKARDGKLVLINTVNMDTYVSQVVQSEVGQGAHEEYYKIQGIICRTYAVGNRERHSAEGFDVCDHQHCQVYGGKAESPTEVVAKATAATSGLVLADSASKAILAVFHANCGGETANAGDVWAKRLPYLVSVTDTFCTDQRSATWTATVPLDDLRDQFGTAADPLLTDGFSLTHASRPAHITLGDQSVRTADLRRDLKLRSAFFDLKVEGNEVLLSGRGFGHGVGLCQQGAMQMAHSGLTYSEILGHYYRGASLINMDRLK